MSLSVCIEKETFPDFLFTIEEVRYLKELLESAINNIMDKNYISDKYDIDDLEAAVPKLGSYSLLKCKDGKVNIEFDIFEVMAIYDVLRNKSKKAKIKSNLCNMFSVYLCNVNIISVYSD